MRGRIVRYESYDFEKIFFDVVYFSSGDDRLKRRSSREWNKKFSLTKFVRIFSKKWIHEFVEIEYNR